MFTTKARKGSVTRLYLLGLIALLVAATSCQNSKPAPEPKAKEKAEQKAEKKELLIEYFEGPAKESTALFAAAIEPMKQIKWPTAEQIPEFRKAMDAQTPPVPDGIAVEPVEAAPVPMEWVYAKDASKDKVLLYFHGGVYVIESAKSRRPFEAAISTAAGVRILSIDYRMAPEHPFPAAVEDAKKAYKWLLEKGYKPGSIALAGDSAGGGLAIAVLLALRNEKVKLPKAAVLLSPWTDLTLQSASIKSNKATDIPLPVEWALAMGKAYAGKAGLKHPQVSPLFSDPTGLPPLLIQAGSAEMLLDDSKGFARKAHEAGVDVSLQVYKGMWHVFQAYGSGVKEAQKAISEIGEFLKKHLG
jgi:epsilon-lactone hydrolase